VGLFYSSQKAKFGVTKKTRVNPKSRALSFRAVNLGRPRIATNPQRTQRPGRRRRARSSSTVRHTSRPRRARVRSIEPDQRARSVPRNRLTFNSPGRVTGGSGEAHAWDGDALRPVHGWTGRSGTTPVPRRTVADRRAPGKLRRAECVPPSSTASTRLTPPLPGFSLGSAVRESRDDSREHRADVVSPVPSLTRRTSR
jgi:hypothetical protein